MIRQKGVSTLWSMARGHYTKATMVCSRPLKTSGLATLHSLSLPGFLGFSAEMNAYRKKRNSNGSQVDRMDPA